jgi:hypothetical protein
MEHEKVEHRDPLLVEKLRSLTERALECAAAASTVADSLEHDEDVSRELKMLEGELESEQTRAGALHAQLTAMKLRALHAHSAIWRAMRGTPEEALAAIGDAGEVHQAVHELLAVDTPTVTVLAEWRAHLERQDERIVDLEEENAELRASTSQWLLGVDPEVLANARRWYENASWREIGGVLTCLEMSLEPTRPMPLSRELWSRLVIIALDQATCGEDDDTTPGGKARR